MYVVTPIDKLWSAELCGCPLILSIQYNTSYATKRTNKSCTKARCRWNACVNVSLILHFVSFLFSCNLWCYINLKYIVRFCTSFTYLMQFCLFKYTFYPILWLRIRMLILFLAVTILKMSAFHLNSLPAYLHVAHIEPMFPCRTLMEPIKCQMGICWQGCTSHPHPGGLSLPRIDSRMAPDVT